jgi:GAF domain-containing protein
VDTAVKAWFEELGKHIPVWGWTLVTILVLVGLAVGIGLVLRGLRDGTCELHLWGVHFVKRDDAEERALHASIENLAKDDQTKRNVLLCARRELERLRGFSGAPIGPADLKEFCREVLDDALAATARGGEDLHRASLWVHAEGEPDKLRMLTAVGFRDEAKADARLHLQRSAAGHVIRTGESRLIPDIATENGFEPKERTSGREYQSVLVVPVKDRDGTVFAALSIDAQAIAYFTEDDRFNVQCLADVMAIAVCHRAGG